MPQPQPKTLKDQLPIAVMMFIVSLVLGMAYNSASPLGLRSSGSGEKTPASTPAAGTTSHKGYFNQTVAVSLEGAPGARLSPGVYGNQTMAVGLAPTQAALPQGDGKYATLTWPEVKALIRDSRNVLIDARVATYYEAEHIPGAISLPANSAAADLAAFAAKYPRTTPLVLDCGSSSCPMSHNLAEILSLQYAFTNIRIMTGGFVEYRQFEAQIAGGAK